ncbi:MAG: hypothetical protein NVS2B14_14570 [Chamaesiphon sp.]
MGSIYADTVPLIVKDLHDELVTELSLPTPFRSSDPNPGEAYGLLSVQNLGNREEMGPVELYCTFLASSAFTTYWDAATWAIKTGLNLDDLTLKINRRVDNRGILDSFHKTTAISVGRPRAPLKAVAGQQPTFWIVDVVMPCVIRLLITRTIDAGHI